jgi:hypothetical protein
MGKANAASVLMVDDQGEGTALASYLQQSKGLAAKVLHPEEVELDDLVVADLVLVDYQLERWPEREGCPVARAPRDGLALSTVFRRHVHDRERTSPTAFAILTGKIETLAAPLPPEHREHVLARMSNLEWVFQKAKPGVEFSLGDQVASLADAVQKLPKQWPLSDAKEAMRQLAAILALDPEQSAASQQLEDVSACIPPIHELSQWSHGLAVIRWLLQRILPYPCFLWDSYYVAARMRVDHRWLCDVLTKSEDLRQWLAPARYTGLLSQFAGQRWWRSRLELLLWESTKQQSFDITQIWAILTTLAKEEVKSSSPPDHPIVCVNSNYQPLEKFEAMEDAVRIRPDDWPSYADQPWVSVAGAQSDPRLGAIVVTEDRGKLDVKRE